jgi:RiboL-PSP-HEPN
MASQALLTLLEALREVDELQRANPTPVGAAPTSPSVTRVVGRASVVLLSSHFERYVYSVNEEAVATLNSAGVTGSELPDGLKVLHSRVAVDALTETGWEKRSKQLEEFVTLEGWLWGGASTGYLSHNKLIVWMKAPTPAALVRYYGIWSIFNIFDAITRTSHTRKDLWLKVDELVAKRNNIAHGDATVEATQADVRSYRSHARKFCESADKQLAQQLRRSFGIARPW